VTNGSECSREEDTDDDDQHPDYDEAGETAATRWREVVGHGVVLRLPKSVEDVNDLAQQPDGEAVS